MVDKRIGSLDGLRTIAALGVVWIHVWVQCDLPSLHVGQLDLYKAVAILGQGVDFFFVISGFCMYLMLVRRSEPPSQYWSFIKKRFIRIAPPFYAAVLVYGAYRLYVDHDFPFVYSVASHLLFLNNFTGNIISGPFWSLSTEWHFYIVLPFLVLGFRYWGFFKTIVLSSTLCIIFSCIVHTGYLNIDWWENQILVRLPEFAFGIVAAWFFVRHKRVPPFFRGAIGLLLSFAVMYIGRALKLAQLVEMAGSFGWFFRSMADYVMTMGFAALMYLVITERSMFASFLACKPMTFLGKISYSIYLWHSLIIILLTAFFAQMQFGAYNPLVGFVVVSAITVPLAWLSYKIFEEPYFKRSKKNEKVSNSYEPSHSV